MRRERKRRRLVYGVVWILLIGIEALIALFVHDEGIRPYGRDVLASLALYALSRVFFPTGIRIMPLLTFLCCALVESPQYLRLVSLLHWEGNVFLRTLLGATFDWRDMLCYLIGSLLAALWEMVLLKLEKGKYSLVENEKTSR